MPKEIDSISQYFKDLKRSQRYANRRPYLYNGLEDYIISQLGTYPIGSQDLRSRVMREFGYIDERTFYRSLNKLLLDKKVKVEDIECEFGNNYQPCQGYSIIRRKRHTSPVFQKQYISILNKRVSQFSHLGRIAN